MIKPINHVQLSSAKTRTGLQRIGDLLPRLIKQYEMQAELARKVNQRDPVELANRIPAVETGPAKQVTFAWYE